MREEHPFSLGDRVRRTGGTWRDVRTGEVYTVIERRKHYPSGDCEIRVAESDETWYGAGLFVLEVPRSPKRAVPVAKLDSFKSYVESMRGDQDGCNTISSR